MESTGPIWRELAKDMALAGVDDWGVLQGSSWIYCAGTTGKLIVPDDSEIADDRLRLVRTNGWRELDEVDPEVDAAADLQTFAMEALWSPFPTVADEVLELRRTAQGGLVWTAPGGREICPVGALGSKLSEDN